MHGFIPILVWIFRPGARMSGFCLKFGIPVRGFFHMKSSSLSRRWFIPFWSRPFHSFLEPFYSVPESVHSVLELVHSVPRFQFIFHSVVVLRCHSHCSGASSFRFGDGPFCSRADTLSVPRSVPSIPFCCSRCSGAGSFRAGADAACTRQLVFGPF